MRLHLVADDLTGALDTAAWFATADDTIPVVWRTPCDLAGAARIAIDSATRERCGARARAQVGVIVSGFPDDPKAINYAKLDSLLRGNAAAEIAAWMKALAPDCCIIAPAFPFQGRITRDGRQFARGEPVKTDLRADLESEGFAVRLRKPGDSVPRGISLWDAETDADLAKIAADGLSLGARVLWCGSSGLAGAMAREIFRDDRAAPPIDLPQPILGLFGTDHPITRRQLAACGDAVLRIPDGGATSAEAVAFRLAGHGAAAVVPALPDGLPADDAARRIAAIFGDLTARLDPPGTLVVAGGETLRGLCDALAADHLALDGSLMPGIPCSILRGGRYDGVRVVSKSGAFGAPDLLHRLLSHDLRITEDIQA